LTVEHSAPLKWGMFKRPGRPVVEQLEILIFERLNVRLGALVFERADEAEPGAIGRCQ